MSSCSFACVYCHNQPARPNDSQQLTFIPIHATCQVRAGLVLPCEVLASGRQT